MKKIYRIILTAATFAATTTLALADGSAFTPLNFDDASYAAPKTPPVTTPVATAPKTSTNPLANALAKVMPAKTTPTYDASATENAIGNSNIQNAILELDNAQVGIRNDLLNYKAKYADVDAQYRLIKNERDMLHRQIVSIERRIRNIDRTKERIRRSML